MNGKAAKRLRRKANDLTIGTAWSGKNTERTRTTPTVRKRLFDGQVSVQRGLQPTSGRGVYQSLKRAEKLA